MNSAAVEPFAKMRGFNPTRASKLVLNDVETDKRNLMMAARDGRLWRRGKRGSGWYELVDESNNSHPVSLQLMGSLLGKHLFIELRAFEEGNDDHKIVTHSRDLR